MATYFDMGRGQSTTAAVPLTFHEEGAARNFIPWHRPASPPVGLGFAGPEPLYAEMDIGGTRIQDIGAYLEREEEWLKA